MSISRRYWNSFTTRISHGYKQCAANFKMPNAEFVHSNFVKEKGEFHVVYAHNGNADGIQLMFWHRFLTIYFCQFFAGRFRARMLISSNSSRTKKHPTSTYPS